MTRRRGRDRPRRFAAPVVVDAAGAWAAGLARTVGLDVPVEPWRHDTAYFGLPAGRTADFPIVIDDIDQVYFRPEGRDMMLVGLEAGNEVGGSPDRPLAPSRPATIEEMVRAALRARAVDGRRHVPHGPRRPGRHHAPTSARSWARPARTASISPAASPGPASRRRRRSAGGWRS